MELKQKYILEIFLFRFILLLIKILFHETGRV